MGLRQATIVAGLTKGYFEYDTQCTLIHIPTGEVWAKAVSGSCNNFEAKYRSLNPYDVKNTLEKMAEKRALVAAVLIGVGASDIFTQDLRLLVTKQAGGRDKACSAWRHPKYADKPVTYFSY